MADQATIDFLRLHKSTRKLSDEQLERLASPAEVVTYRADQVVQTAGEEVEALLLIISGQLEVTVSVPDRAARPIDYLGRDDQFGFLGLFQAEPLPMTVIAKQDTTVVRIVKHDALQLARELPLWTHGLMKALGPVLRNAFLNEKKQRGVRLIAILHADNETRTLTPELLDRLFQLGETVGLMSDDAATLGRAHGPVHSMLDENGAEKSSELLRRVAAGWPDANRIVVDASMAIETANLTALLGPADVVYVPCTSGAANRTADRLGKLVSATPAMKRKLNVVRVLRSHEQVAPRVPVLATVCEREFKLHWDGWSDSPACTRRAGMERLVHHLRGASIGLALGGGAARGMAHLGVLQVLDREGITIDRMSGTSAGALTGIQYAAGHSADFIVQAFAHDLKPAWYYRMLPYGDGCYMLGKFRRRGWDTMLRKYLQDWYLEQLPIPFTSVTADLVAAGEVRRSRGDATLALLESINLPGIARPICRDGMALVDGGVFNVVPADVLVEQGASLVVAVDVAARIRFEFAGNHPETPTEQMHVPSTAQTMVRVRTVQDRNIRSMGGSAADLIIEPDVSTVEIADFKRAANIARLGQAAAEEALPRLRQLLHQLDDKLFPLD